MDSLAPALDTPALLAANLSLLEVGKLPQVVNGVEVSYLHEPSADTLHDLASRLEAASPVGLPLKEVAGVESV